MNGPADSDSWGQKAGARKQVIYHAVDVKLSYISMRPEMFPCTNSKAYIKIKLLCLQYH